MPSAAPSLRIVSLAPSATSILVALGARKHLVGVSKWCPDVAPEVEDLPRVGDCWSLDAASVLRLRPTLVIGAMPYKAETVGKLLEQPLTFLAMNPRTLADVESDIHLLGVIAGRAAAARRLVSRMRADFKAIRSRAKSAKTKTDIRVYCEAWPNPRISSPPWVAELVEIVGGKMVLPAGKRVSDAEVAVTQPEVIILAWAATGSKSDPQQTYEVAAFHDIPAVKNRRVYSIRDELLNTPGPPLVEGARQLLHLIHPHRMKSISRAPISKQR
ncbi:MAG TPA: ABC transporter substrate-binding protein [Candidatus Limnocylindrales bacterium]|nr:ABC transporter substrate-binding protein [Candidatus Limnocylindrales bacterium]